MALIAAVALGVTVLVAQRALTHASDVVVRGEANALVSAIVADSTQEDSGPTAAWLEHELIAHEAQGLRYVAIMQRETVLSAGVATMPEAKLRPGDTLTIERRVRVAAFLPPMRPQGGFLDGVKGPRPRPSPSLLVIELEPPVIEQLRGHLTRISIVAAGAAVVLVGFAFALSRYAARLAAFEHRTAREQRLVALGSMSSVMAHELRNPLASLKGHAQLLAEDLDEGKAKKKAERVVAEAQRIEELTTSLLDFVRDGPIERTESTAAALSARALTDLPIERVDVKLQPSKNARDATMVIDEPRLARAVHNLVDNALKAGAEAGDEASRVELSIAREAGDVVIAVRDRGPGITDGTQMFEPFVTTRVRGTGLGLPVARRIAERHGGTLTGENHPEGGALFTLRFPARSA